jgi:hypothetical protein
VDLDLLDLYTRASACALTKVGGAAAQLEAPTTCEYWEVRTLMNHMLLVQSAFVAHIRRDP